MVRVVAFDVNETLLDLAALDEPFTRAFGSAASRPLWFAQMLQLAFVGTITGEYIDFGTAQHAALRMLAARTGTDLDPADADAIVTGMRRLPPHPEVRAALTALRGSPLAVAALTNSTREVAEAQIVNAGLRDLFDAVLSADDVRRLPGRVRGPPRCGAVPGRPPARHRRPGPHRGGRPDPRRRPSTMTTRPT